MELGTASNFFQEKDTHFVNYLCQYTKVLLKTASYSILSHKVSVSNINDEFFVNASEANPRRCSILGVF